MSLEKLIPTCSKPPPTLLLALLLVLLAVLVFVTMALKSKHVNIALLFAMLLGNLYMLYAQLIGYNCSLLAPPL